MASLPADTAAGSTFFEGSHEEDEENKAPEPNRSSDADDPGILKAPPEHLRFTSSSTQKACMVSESFVSRSADEGSSVCLALRPVHPDRNGGGRCPYTAAPMPSPRREGSPLGDLRIRAVSKVFLRLEEAPRAVRDLWKISFEGKQLRRRYTVTQGVLTPSAPPIVRRTTLFVLASYRACEAQQSVLLCFVHLSEMRCKHLPERVFFLFLVAHWIPCHCSYLFSLHSATLFTFFSTHSPV